MKRAIHESVMSTDALRVDRKAGIIHGVKVLGLVSENGRRYTPEAIKAAVKLYEGVRVNVDHPEKDAGQPRSAYDRLGKLINIRYVEGEGLYGDFEILMTHPMAKRICEAAERMPDAFGMSHNAQGEGDEDKDGIFVVSRIVEVRHVDLVADPATTKSLSESKQVKESKMDDKLKEAYDAMREAWDKLEGCMKEAYSEAEDDKDDDKDAMEAADEPASEEAEEKDEEKADTEEAEGADSEKAEKDDEKDAEESDDGDEDDKKGAMEGKASKPSKLAKLVEENRALKARELARTLCESAGLKADAELLNDLAAMPKDAAERTVQRLAQKANKPRSGYTVTESRAGGIPDGEALFNWLAN